MRRAAVLRPVINLVSQEVELDLLQEGCCGGCLRVEGMVFSYLRSHCV